MRLPIFERCANEMKPSAFESAVLERIAANTDDEELREQLSTVEVAEREHTGVGCYTKIFVRGGAGRTWRTAAWP